MYPPTPPSRKFQSQWSNRSDFSQMDLSNWPPAAAIANSQWNSYCELSPNHFSPFVKLHCFQRWFSRCYLYLNRPGWIKVSLGADTVKTMEDTEKKTDYFSLLRGSIYCLVLTNFIVSTLFIIYLQTSLAQLSLTSKTWFIVANNASGPANYISAGFQ